MLSGCDPGFDLEGLAPFGYGWSLVATSPQQFKTSVPGGDDTVPFLLKQPAVQLFRDKEKEGGLTFTEHCHFNVCCI